MLNSVNIINNVNILLIVLRNNFDNNNSKPKGRNRQNHKHPEHRGRINQAKKESFTCGHGRAKRLEQKPGNI